MLDLQAFRVVQGDERIRTAVGFQRIDAWRFNPSGARGVRVRHVTSAVLMAARTLDRLTARGAEARQTAAVCGLLHDGLATRPRAVSLWGAA